MAKSQKPRKKTKSLAVMTDKDKRRIQEAFHAKIEEYSEMSVPDLLVLELKGSYDIARQYVIRRHSSKKDD